MYVTPQNISLLILGSGEVARLLATLAHHAEYIVTVCDNRVDQYRWPEGIALKSFNFSDHAWQLAAHTHAIIARGHQGDAENIVSLLEHNSSHVYLIASAARAQRVIENAMPQLSDPARLDRLSAPAGLSLGGQSSYEIAMSILAEIQWRRHGKQKIQCLTELRTERLNKSLSGQRQQSCPGKRP